MMISVYHIDEFLSQTTPVVDVRSPGEYAHAHIPGSVNIPLLNDEERKQVGICFKNLGKREATLLGYELTGKKFADYARKAIKIAGDENMLRLYCWRGGMRSEVMAQIFANTGIKSCLLKRGYKTFRKWVLEKLNEQYPFIIIGGKTGCGKTEYLNRLEQDGEQVIDLEALANHRGSTYGGIGLGEQPSNEHFENMLAVRLAKMKKNNTIWIENESRTIGRNKIPDAIFQQMRKSNVKEIEIPQEIREKRILNEYAPLPKDQLIAATRKLEKRLGNHKMNRAVEHLEKDQFEQWVRILLEYYDSAYEYSNSHRDKETITKIFSDTVNH